MSSQNYLSNVFRQVYTYSNGQFVPSINLSNVSKITADSLTVTTLSLGGSNDNLYFGEGAGSLDPNSANNTAIGVQAAGSVSNVNNSVFLGRSAGLGVNGAEAVIGIGVTTKGTGTSNIYIGNGTGSTADNSVSNIYIGHAIDTASAVSNQLRIGQDGNVLLAGDFNTKWLGVGTLTPTNGYKLDVSGGANVAGDLLVAGNINAGSIGTSAISGPRTRMQDGSASYPSYSFINDTSLGLYSAGGHSMGFANQGIQVMCISGTRVGINTPNPSTTLEVNGDISANSYNGPDGTVSLPKYSFSSARNTGIYLDSGKLSFAVDGVKQFEMTSNGVVNTNDVAINSVLRDANVPVDYDISGGNIRMTRTLTTSNIVGNYASSNQIGGVTLDNGAISNSGAITTDSITTTGSTSNSIGGTVFQSNSVTLYGPITSFSVLDSNQIGGVTLSYNNVSLGGTITGTDPSSSNQIGGVTLSNNNIAMSGTIIGSTANTSNQIGGVTLSNNDIAMSGAIVGSTANTSNQIGGVTLSNNDITTVGKMKSYLIQNGALGDGQTYALQETVGGLSSINPTALPAISFQEGGFNGGYRHFIQSRHDYNDGIAPQNLASNAIDFYTNTSTGYNGSTGPGTGNVLAMSVTSAGVGIGTDNIGYALNVSGTAYASEGVIASNFTTLSASSNTIGGVILDNSNTTSSNFTTPTASSNDIGGVILSNNNIRIGAPVDTNQYAIQEFGGGTNGAGEDGSTAIAFQRGGASVTGGFRHFIRSRHSGNITNLFCNSLDFYLNNAGASTTSTAPGTGNTLAMSVTAGGVGIGTIKPGAALDVSGSFRLDTSSGGSIRAFVASDTYGNLAMNGYFTVSRNNTNIGGLSNENEILTLLAADTNTTNYFMSNYVAIGRRTAASRLHLMDTVSSTDASQAIILQTGSIKNKQSSRIEFRGTDSGSSIPLSSITGIDTGTGPSAYRGDLTFMTTSGANLYPERMRIRYDGNVGIGTTAPAYTLDVSGAIASGTTEYTVFVTSSTTVSVPTGFTMAHITLVAGGAGGGGGKSGGGGGGGGGGGAGWRVEQLVTNPSSMTVTIGLGGAGGAPGSVGSSGGLSRLTYTGLASGTMEILSGSGGSSTSTVAGGTGGNGYYGGGAGGGGNGSGSAAAGGTGIILPGSIGGFGAGGGYGGLGGGQMTGAGAVNPGGGGGGGGPAGGKGGAAGSDGTAGAPGCGGGGGGSGATGGRGGDGYCIVKFMR
jgi:hypothetical protein